MDRVLCGILAFISIQGSALRTDQDDGEISFPKPCTPTETSAYNQVVIPTVTDFTKWKDVLSTATGLLSNPISDADAFMVDMTLRTSLLSYGRLPSKWSYASFGIYAEKGGDVPVLAEIQIRGEVDHKRSKSGDYQEDDCPAAAIYVIRLADGGVGLILSFKGTSNVLDWMRNLDLRSAPFRGSKDAKVHRGFQTHLGHLFDSLGAWRLRELNLLLHSWGVEELDPTRNALDYVLHGNWSWCICTGHSLGGAMAALAAETIAVESDFKPVYEMTVAAPIPGNPSFISEMARDVKPKGGLRIENPLDPVPWIGYGGAKLRSRTTNGMGWVLPQDASMSKASPRNSHTFYHVETTDADGDATCKFYTFQPFTTEGDPEQTALTHYDQLNWMANQKWG
ncbi:unnamed protein product [Symbiodinium necroappetens]|uniref:Fungal lipase-type domain-containing protein n=1 Tax=Symbiodinium necroappetens TaxID=1628268 RepID=A0A812QGX0_9DINO|nr:unnamed protein product [Symbiodinium necroappetens]